MVAEETDDSTKFCQECGSRIKQKAEICPKCGVRQPGANQSTTAPETKFCRDCGAEINAQAELCPECGIRQQGAVDSSPGEKSRVVAILLALFLGGLGAHKFYLGQPGWGILYLLFFWTFIPAFVAFIEMIIYLVMSDRRFAEKYG